MTQEHWFDTLNKFLTQDAPRRGVVGALTALALGNRLAADEATAKKGGNGGKGGKGRKSDGKGGKGGKHTGKGNDRKKDHGNNNGNSKQNGNQNGTGGGSGNEGGSDSGTEPANQVPPSCGEDVCGAHLPEAEWLACVEKCGRCRIRDKFCVVKGDAMHPDPHATCCFEDQQCCQDSRTCCDRSETCCPSDPVGCCAAGEACCPGVGCCLAGASCCPDGCYDLSSDPYNCGVCGHACIDGEVCHQGQCFCADPDACGCQRDSQCPQGQLCLTQDDQYLCNATTDDNCHCGCGPDYNYCWNRASSRYVCFSDDCSLLA
jgi:hypothetical protein